MACADPLAYRETALRLDAAGVDALHFDICDGHFAPTFLLAPALLRALRPLTARRFDAHLYCTHPSRYLQELQQAGADLVVVHVEAAEEPAEVVPQILAAGMRAGVALLPGTPVPPALASLLPVLSQVVINMVGPAYAGQPFDARGLANARSVAETAHARRIEVGTTLEIAADGNVSAARLPALLESGCTHLVCGTSSIFRPAPDGRDDIGAALRAFRQVVDQSAEKTLSHL
jgi:ribulose-phosphate 3-epimerase